MSSLPSNNDLIYVSNRTLRRECPASRVENLAKIFIQSCQIIPPCHCVSNCIAKLRQSKRNDLTGVDGSSVRIFCLEYCFRH